MNKITEDTMHLVLRRNPADSGVLLNGKKLDNVTNIAIKADVNNPPQATLTIKPERMIISSDIRPSFRFSHPVGYDPYNSVEDSG